MASRLRSGKLPRHLQWAFDDSMDWTPVPPPPALKRPFDQFADEHPGTPMNAHEELLINHTNDIHPLALVNHTTPATPTAASGSSHTRSDIMQLDDPETNPGIIRRFASFFSKFVPSIFTRRQNPEPPVELNVAYIQHGTRRQRVPGEWPASPTLSPRSSPKSSPPTSSRTSRVQSPPALQPKLNAVAPMNLSAKQDETMKMSNEKFSSSRCTLPIAEEDLPNSISKTPGAWRESPASSTPDMRQPDSHFRDQRPKSRTPINRKLDTVPHTAAAIEAQFLREMNPPSYVSSSRGPYTSPDAKTAIEAQLQSELYRASAAVSIPGSYLVTPPASPILGATASPWIFPEDSGSPTLSITPDKSDASEPNNSSDPRLRERLQEAAYQAEQNRSRSVQIHVDQEGWNSEKSSNSARQDEAFGPNISLNGARHYQGTSQWQPVVQAQATLDSPTKQTAPFPTSLTSPYPRNPNKKAYLKRMTQPAALSLDTSTVGRVPASTPTTRPQNIPSSLNDAFLLNVSSIYTSLNTAQPRIAAATTLIPVTAPTIDEELSFLSDAPAARNVQWVKGPVSDKPEISRIKQYTVGEAMSYPKGEPGFVEPHTPAETFVVDTPQAEPATNPRLGAALEALDTPRERPNPSDTPENVKDLQEDFAAFEISTESRAERDEKAAAERRRRLEEEKLIRKIERLKRKKEEEARKREEEDAFNDRQARIAIEAGELEERRKAERQNGLVMPTITNRERLVKELEFPLEQDLDRRLAITDPSAVIVEKGITRKDLGTLLPQSRAEGIGWLNDEVVNAYIDLTVKRMHQRLGYRKESGKVPAVHAFTTFLYSTFAKRGYAGVRRWVERAKLAGPRFLELEVVVIPINHGHHWTLIVILPDRRQIAYYDSLGGKGTQYTKFAKEFVAGVLGDDYDESEWKVAVGKTPQQENGVDCGVFVCLNAASALQYKRPFDEYTAEEIPRARRMIGAVLVNGGFSEFSIDL